MAHSLRAEGFDASEDGTGRGTPIVPVAIHADAIGRDGISKTAGPDAAGVVRKRDAGLGIIDDGSVYSLTTGQPHAIAIQERAVSDNPDAGPDGKGWRDDGAAYTLEARQVSQAVAAPVAIAFTAKDHGGDAVENISPTLRAGGHTGSHANAGVMPAIAFTTEQTPKARSECALTLTKQSPTGGGQVQSVASAWGVRRLTPTECERLQGFPDGWTAIPWGKKAPEDCPDGPRYKALGNSMAVNVMCFIGERIEAVRAAEVNGAGNADPA